MHIAMLANNVDWFRASVRWDGETRTNYDINTVAGKSGCCQGIVLLIKAVEHSWFHS